MKDLEVLAVIGARGGSKTVLKKNIRELAGKPLIAWTILAAKDSKHVTRVLVSTDDPEIAEVAKAYGAEVPFLRPIEISGDTATDVEFLNHALGFLADKEGYNPDIVLRLPPTSPLRTAKHIDEGIEKLINSPGADAVRPITEAPKHPYKMWKVSNDRKWLEPFLPPGFTGLHEPHNMPRQLFPKVYIHTGAMDVMWTKTITEFKSTQGRKLAYFEMPSECSVNIDSLLDFELAEMIMKKRQDAVFGTPTTKKRKVETQKADQSKKEKVPVADPVTNRPGRFDFEGLMILDMANNHQGDVEHGKRIIRESAAVVAERGARATVKFQFRNLDTFIHPDHLRSSDNKHVGRFLSTRLSEEEFKELADEVRRGGMITMATPFDEDSVDMLQRLDIDVIKVASCSAIDWPLLTKIAEAGKPVVCSTAGLSLTQVDNLVSFFDHRGVDYALMHCVAVYPTPTEKLNLDRIRVFRERYPHISVGYSTHEDPSKIDIIKYAYALGARLFERHVGIATDTIKLNAYSSTPEQIGQWLDSHQEAVIMGQKIRRQEEDEEEVSSLNSLARGVYANRDLKAGQTLARQDVFFAMPVNPGQLTSGQWKEGMVADQDYRREQALSATIAGSDKLSKKQLIYKAVHEVKGILNAAHIAINYESNVELSHHYGMEKFFETGATIIDCINREYCKKVIVILPGQSHPEHYHKKKEETFQILAGQLEVDIEGRNRILYPGDTLLVPRGVWHSFSAPQGAIFEEVSTTHFNDDSFYADKTVNTMPREERKTKLINWGRHQFD